MTNNSLLYHENGLNSELIKMIKNMLQNPCMIGLFVTELCNKHEKHQEQLKMINK
ncbi:hypothetical protein LOOC260_102520 [Paucilactobacillus hokkaidonensis JCM 18461]|uniref:Uncharacterized protein n=1 Tax=Paucilactobacillus hokkaidonensis JCM 18461 TaxID=1291742 RepID=A0A0A1GS50_9LACO|nr:hypothetical protein LOOC260_102520 [Paucilactobacillus hokkaidonensis JCM 18461]